MQPVLNVGGNWNNGSNCGLWYWNGNNSASNANSTSRPIDFVGFRFYKEKVVLRKKIFFRLCRRVRNVKKAGYITVSQARGLLSLLGWLTHINGWKFYREKIYPFAPKWKLKKIVSNYAKKIMEVMKNGIQQKEVVGICQQAS